MDTKPIFQFLTHLKDNNNKSWFHANRPQYETAKKILLEITEEVTLKLSKFDPTIDTLMPKESILRINRDIRFTKDKTPYKNHMGFFISRYGKSLKLAGYYLEFTPSGEALIAGGIYNPESSVLKKIRKAIHNHPNALKKIERDEKFKKIFKNIHGKKLKTSPKGYSITDPAIGYLKMKSFYAQYNLSKSEVISNDIVNKIVNSFKILVPFISFLYNATNSPDNPYI